MNQSNLSNAKAMQYALLSVALLLFIPFIVSSRYLPYKEFYQDILLLLLASIAFIAVALTGKLPRKLPIPTVVFLCLSAYWLLQPLVLDLSYANKNLRVALLFVVLAGLCWAIPALIAYWGREKVIVWVMRAIMLGALFQSLAVIMQATGWAESVSWLFFYNPPRVEGQFGQRNLLGHYLTWGIISACYLLSVQAIKKWQGIAVILLIGSIMGLVSSRSIILYLIVLAMLFVGIKLLRRQQNTRNLNIYFYAIAFAFVAQWVVPPVVLALFDYSIQSGLDRLQQAAFTGVSSRVRLEEWQKAWEVFLEYPIWGSGWETYSYFSLTKGISNVPDTLFYPQGILQHCHNSVLQIMAEMGIIGFIMTFGGLLWSLSPIFKKYYQSEHVVLLALLAVSCAHSLVEFPLWYSYFLAGFAVFLALGQPQPQEHKTANPIVSKTILASSSLLLLSGVSILALNQFYISKQHSSLDTIDKRASATIAMGERIPLFADYGDLHTIINADPTQAQIDANAAGVIDKYIHYTPSSIIANLHGLYLYRQGKTQASLDWMKKSWHYYPRLVPRSMKIIYANSPMFKGLEQPVYQACLRYRELNLYPDFFDKKCMSPPSDE